MWGRGEENVDGRGFQINASERFTALDIEFYVRPACSFPQLRRVFMTGPVGVALVLFCSQVKLPGMTWKAWLPTRSSTGPGNRVRTYLCWQRRWTRQRGHAVFDGKCPDALLTGLGSVRLAPGLFFGSAYQVFCTAQEMLPACARLLRLACLLR